ncbi:MAG: hypothetical protein K9M97_05775, partial [Akkermansiaceae bacterium]|nr:hypothetical protein [Akkermansiaceae bacterium]
IRQLTVEGHGRPGLQSVGPMEGGRTTVKASIGVYKDAATGKYRPLGFDLFRGVKFCKPCSIVLRGCNQGTGGDSRLEVTPVQEFAMLLRNTTGCTVSGFANYCHTEDPDLGGRSHPKGTYMPTVLISGYAATDDAHWNTVPKALEDTINDQKVIHIEVQQ